MSSGENNDIKGLFDRIVDSVNAAQAHYQTWFTLRGQGKALPGFHSVMDDYRYVDFFEASNAGHYKLMFLELGCLFDPDTRAASIRNLKQALIGAGFIEQANTIDSALRGYGKLVSSILTIRSKLIAHKEIGASSIDVHSKNGVIPDEVGKLINICCLGLNNLNDDLFEGKQKWADNTDRYERATFGLLEVLRNGRT